MTTLHKTEEELTEVAKKVKKLLALSKSSNEHEAGVAMSKAKEILDKYNMTLSDLEIKTAEFGDMVLEVKYKVAPKWVFRVAALVADNTFCKVLIGKNYVRMIGSKVDMEVSKYIFYYLYNTLSSLSKAYCAQYYQKVSLGELNSMKINYIDGAIYSIAQTFKEMRTYSSVMKHEVLVTTDGTDLMVVKTDAVNEYYNKTVGKRTSVNIGSSAAVNVNAFIAGVQEGKNINIHKGVTSSGKSQRAIA